MDEFLKYKIMEVGGINFSVYNLVLTGIFIVITTIILFIIKRIIYKIDKFDEGKKYANTG